MQTDTICTPQVKQTSVAKLWICVNDVWWNTFVFFFFVTYTDFSFVCPLRNLHFFAFILFEKYKRKYMPYRIEFLCKDLKTYYDNATYRFD